MVLSSLGELHALIMADWGGKTLPGDSLRGAALHCSCWWGLSESCSTGQERDGGGLDGVVAEERKEVV